LHKKSFFPEKVKKVENRSGRWGNSNGVLKSRPGDAADAFVMIAIQEGPCQLHIRSLIKSIPAGPIPAALSGA
jgi:hypothetical protein